MAPSRVVLLHGIQSGPSTFWRVRADLETLGAAVAAPTLPGLAGRAPLAQPSLPGLAAAVESALDDGPALVAGHSLGALVALELALRRPDRVLALVLEDPPSRSVTDLGLLRQEVGADAAAARADPDAVVARLLVEQPLWAREDAVHAVENRAAVDDAHAVDPLEAARWDVPALARRVGAPITVLLASPEESATSPEDRTALLERAETGIEVESGHGVHRDRPGVWVAAVARALDGSLPSAPGRPVP